MGADAPGTFRTAVCGRVWCGHALRFGVGSDGGRVCEGNINLESKKESISRYMFWTVALVYYKKCMILILSLALYKGNGWIFRTIHR